MQSYGSFYLVLVFNFILQFTKNITHFSIETAGNFDLDAELKIWISGMGAVPIEKTFNKNLNIYELQSVLAEYVLNA